MLFLCKGLDPLLATKSSNSFFRCLFIQFSKFFDVFSLRKNVWLIIWVTIIKWKKSQYSNWYLPINTVSEGLSFKSFLIYLYTYTLPVWYSKLYRPIRFSEQCKHWQSSCHFITLLYCNAECLVQCF